MRGDRTPRRRALAALITIGGAGLGLVAGPVGPLLAADACANFSTVGAADGVRVGVKGTGLIVNEADSEGPAAQASVNSLGQSLAFAGAPYPGDAVISGVGIANQDASQLPNYVATQYPSKRKDEKTTPGSRLTASSEEFSAAATARGGGGSTPEQTTGDTTSTAAAGCADNGDIASDATTDTQALSFAAGTLRIGRIQSEAHAKISAEDKPRLSASLDVGRMTVAGQTLTVTEEGVQYPGGSVPVGNPLEEVLASAGVTVTYIAEQVDRDGMGIRAPGLLVETTQDAAQGQLTTVTYTFGRAYARASGDAGDEVAPPDTTGDNTGTVVPERAPEGDLAAPALGAPVLEPGSVGPPAAPDPVAAPQPTDQDTPSTVAARSSHPLALSPTSIYLALVVGAIAIFVGGTLLRLFGVRLAWT